MAQITKFTEDLIGECVFKSELTHNGGTQHYLIGEVVSENEAKDVDGTRLTICNTSDDGHTYWNDFYTTEAEADGRQEGLDYSFKRSYDSYITNR